MVVLSALLVLSIAIGIVGCGGGGGGGLGAILGGAILLTVIFSGGSTAPLAFAASQRERPVAAIFAASKAQDYKARNYHELCHVSSGQIDRCRYRGGDSGSDNQNAFRYFSEYCISNSEHWRNL